MSVISYNIEFVIDKTYVAHCFEFKGWSKYIQIHVWVKVEDNEAYFNFYKHPEELFWFELMKSDEQVAYKIASVLATKFNLKVVKRPGMERG